MSAFEPIDLDFRLAELEFQTFKAFMDRNARFSEREIVNQLKSRVHLSCLIGCLMNGMRKPSSYKFELGLQGVFRTDLIIGNLEQQRFVFVEFEGGEEYSLFGPRHTNQMRGWSKALERGFSQIIDWGWARSDSRNSRIFQNIFGCEDFKHLYVLVCGRDSTMNPVEKSRFNWRCDNIRLSGIELLCMTYDGLLLHFEASLEAIKSYTSEQR